MIILQRKWVCLIVILLTHKWGELDQSTHRSYLSEQAFFKELAPGPSLFKQPAKTVNPPASNFLARLWPNPLSQPERKHKKTVRARWGEGRGESFAFKKPEALHVFEMQCATSPHPTPPPSELIKFQCWIKISFNVWVKYFLWNFKGYLWNPHKISHLYIWCGFYSQVNI